MAGEAPSPAQPLPQTPILLQRPQPPPCLPRARQTRERQLGPLPGPGLLLGKGPPMSSSCGESRAEKRELANCSQDPESLGKPALGRGKVGCPRRAAGGAGMKQAAD